MSRMTPSLLAALLAASALVFASPARAERRGEYEDYDDEYDDEEYDDEEAAGADDYDDDYDDEAAGELDDDDDDEVAPVRSRPRAEPSARTRFAHPSLHGESGLFHVVAADSGEMLTFSVGLHTNFFLVSDWLVEGDDNRFIGGAVHVRFTVWDYIEAYFAINNYANANPMEEPQLFQTLGDMVIGLKGFYPVLPWLTVGGGVGLYLLNQVGDVAFAGSSTGAALRALATFDVQRATGNIPLRFHLNFEYLFDNSAALVEEVERRRAGVEDGNGCSYDRDGDGDPDDDAGCITRIERTALHISRLDTVWIRFGIEAPLPYVTPIAELNIGIPANRQGFNCIWREGEEGLGTRDGEHDTCYDVERTAALPMWITLGARVEPWVPGLALNLGVDIGVLGTNTFVHELPAVPPYMVYLGLSYAYNPRARVVEQVREVEVEVESEPPPPPPVIAGRVVDAESREGIGGALVSFPGRELNPIATRADGSFRSWPLAAGEVQVHAEHEDYAPADCAATLPSTGEAALECAMTALPRRGTLGGRVTNEEGGAIAGASVTIFNSAGQRLQLSSDARGEFQRELDAGTYRIEVEAEGHMRRGGREVTIAPRERTNLELQLRVQPRRALVRVQGDQIQILQPVHFRTDSAEIDPDSHALLEQVADIILRNPDLCRIEVQGHTDNRGGRDHNQTLSEQRAASVVDYLVQMGVARDRLSSRGFGMDRPVAPNITSAGRARNRRVELHILERCPAGVAR